MAVLRLRAPRADQAVLAEPPLAGAAGLLARNRQLLTRGAGALGDLLGKPWATLQIEARAAAAHAACDYLRHAGEPVPVCNPSSLVIAGHQPELFHPGVWVKSFVLNALARRHNATPINLIVDNDVAKMKGLHVPVLTEPGSNAHADRHVPAARLALAPFDRSAAEAPYEEHTVADEEWLAGFPGRLHELIRSWSFQPLAHHFWTEMASQVPRTPLLGERFAATRRIFERRWGCHNAELPVSVLCRNEPFAWFACHLLAELPRFHPIYNDCVHDYRRRHGLRSRNHPVPDLEGTDGWLEAPFWAWRAGDKRRRRLLARLAKDVVELRAGDEGWPSLTLPSGNDGTPMVRSWLSLERNGFKVRSRALTNTLFARLFLADLFVHGIGGGKYDEVTDAIVRRFYGIEPLGYLVISATLLLPLPAFNTRSEDRSRLARDARDLHYNPQRHLTSVADMVRRREVEQLAIQKQAWIAGAPVDKNGRKHRFRELRSLNDQLLPYLADRETEMRRELAEIDGQLQVNAVLQRRDYAFCLFPADRLRHFCTQFLADQLYDQS
jgi:hypothetical protein